MLSAAIQNHGREHTTRAHSCQPTPYTACLAIVWIDGLASKDQEEMLLDSLSGSKGVNQATFSRRSPDLLIVDYDRQQTKALDLLEVLNQQNIRAKLVGC